MINTTHYINGQNRRKKNKEKLQVNDPSLNSTRSSSFDLELDEFQVHFEPLLIPAQKHNKEKLCQVAKPLGKLEIKWKGEMSR
jgi:hypothetical protein